MQRGRLAAAALAACLLVPPLARADNPMGYRLLTEADAASLPRQGGGLGLDIERAQVLTDAGMTFDIIRIKSVRPGQAGARAGLKAGDSIIAVDGRVFASLRAFAAYIGSLPPGTQTAVDLIPAGGGPGQAQRIAVTLASRPGQAAPPPSAQAGGLTTGQKLAIGVGAAALLGCYEMGCFSHKTAPQPAPVQPPQPQPTAQ